MISVMVSIAIIILGLIFIYNNIITGKITPVLFGFVLLGFGVTGLLFVGKCADNNNSRYIPAEPLAHNQTQTVFTTDEGTYLADGLYPDGTYLLTVDSKDVLVVWQAVDGKVG